MNDLDEKLRDILLGPTSTDEAVAQIKAAFQEAGYIKVNLDAKWRPDQMTGAEWYKKFKAELPKGLDKYVDIDRAARRAAGLTEGIR